MDFFYEHRFKSYSRYVRRPFQICSSADEHRFPFRVHFLASAYKQVRPRSAYRKCSFFFMFVYHLAGVDVYLHRVVNLKGLVGGVSFYNGWEDVTYQLREF